MHNRSNMIFDNHSNGSVHLAKIIMLLCILQTDRMMADISTVAQYDLFDDVFDENFNRLMFYNYII